MLTAGNTVSEATGEASLPSYDSSHGHHHTRQLLQLRHYLATWSVKLLVKLLYLLMIFVKYITTQGSYFNYTNSLLMTVVTDITTQGSYFNCAII